jgi:molybdate transport system substrate-binding protein
VGGLLVLGATVGHASAAELVVSAASSLSNAMREVATAYEASHPGTTVLLNLAASDVLLAQIAKGAPADVLATADEQTMDKAQQRGLVIAGTRGDFAGNRLTLAVPASSPRVLTGLQALTDAGVKRIAIGNPATVPAGRYAKEALVKAGLWQALVPKLVYAENVRQALDYIARGEVDAGFVYATDAAIVAPRARVVAEVPLDAPVRYPVAVVEATQHPAQARAFAAFLITPPARRILERYGFSQAALP